jgi:hypothetical protein
MRYGALAVALAGIVAVFSWPAGPFAAQAPTTARSGGSGTARTAWGDPDLQGKWQTVETATPMERPKEFANREVLTDQEVTARVDAFMKRSQAVEDADADIAFPEIKKVAPEHEKGIRGQEYNRFWVDAGPTRVRRWSRTSLVIDPPDGRLPPFTLEAIKRIEAREAVRHERGEADSWEDRNQNERCLQTVFVRVNAVERSILQAPGYVAINVLALNTNEPVIVPLDNRTRPSAATRRWLGVSRGRWDDTTLVIETTNINGMQDGGPILPTRTPYQRFLGPGDTVRITERFKRVDAETIEYTYTVEDPKTYVRPYTVMRPLTKADDSLLMPENACHEGNYGIVGQLSAARADEAYALNASRAEQAGRQSQLQEMKRRTEEWVRAHPQQR